MGFQLSQMTYLNTWKKFSSAIFICRNGHDRGEKEKSTREMQRKIFELTRRVLCGETMTNGCSSTTDQDIDLICSTATYVKRFRSDNGQISR